jgi:putative flippase GtrA
VENDYKSNMKSINTLFEIKFIKYCLTGVFNTVHHYVWFLLLSPLLGFAFSNLISFIIANIASFFINSYFTFRVPPSLRSFIKYPSVIAVQAVIAYLVPTFCLAIFPNSKWFVPFLTTLINLPIGYLLTKKVIQN